MIQNSDVDFAVGFVYNRHTRRVYASALRPLVGRTLVKDTVRDYVATWIGLAQNTIVVRRAALAHFVKVMAEYYKCDATLLDGMVYPQGAPEKRRRAVSDEEVAKLFQAAKDTSDRMLLSLLLETGLRLSNIGHIRFRDALGESFHLTIKRDKQLEVFTTPVIRALAEKLVQECDAADEDYIFHSNSGGPGSYIGLYKKLRRLATVAGCKVTAHMFRHRFITRTSETADIAAACELVGHASITTTKRYVHPSRARLIDAVQRTGEAHKYVNSI